MPADRMPTDRMPLPCPVCSCAADVGLAAHAIQAALRVDDFDAAIERGLLDAGNHCDVCTQPCRESLHAARIARQQALDARERFRRRDARLTRRRQERDARRKAPTPGNPANDAIPGLPAAAAAALARAKAKAAGRDGQ